MSDQKKQFIYVLKLTPSLIDPDNWTEIEERIVEKHFARLQELLQQGKLILAGKTAGEHNEKTFGIVILEVGSEAEAMTIMNTDPAVAEGIMTAQLFPYHVALIRS